MEEGLGVFVGNGDFCVFLLKNDNFGDFLTPFLKNYVYLVCYEQV